MFSSLITAKYNSDQFRICFWPVMCSVPYDIFHRGGAVRSNSPQGPKKKARTGADVVICCSDSEAWDYMPLVSGVIPANLGFGFTLRCGHSLRPERSGNMEVRTSCVSAGFIWWRMYLLLLLHVLQSAVLAARSCPALCACTYGNSGITELRWSDAGFILVSVCLCVCNWFASTWALQLIIVWALAYYWSSIGSSIVMQICKCYI